MGLQLNNLPDFQRQLFLVIIWTMVEHSMELLQSFASNAGH